MSFRHRALRLFLPLLLVFSQQQAVLHLLGHDLSQLSAALAAQSSSKDPADPQELVCAKCLSIAHLDHIVIGDLPRIEPVRATPDVIVAVASPSRDLPFFSRYRTRAPPIVS